MREEIKSFKVRRKRVREGGKEGRRKVVGRGKEEN